MALGDKPTLDEEIAKWRRDFAALPLPIVVGALRYRLSEEVEDEVISAGTTAMILRCLEELEKVSVVLLSEDELGVLQQAVSDAISYAQSNGIDDTPFQKLENRILAQHGYVIRHPPNDPFGRHQSNPDDPSTTSRGA